jgi:hypothetical protein
MGAEVHRVRGSTRSSEGAVVADELAGLAERHCPIAERASHCEQPHHPVGPSLSGQYPLPRLDLDGAEYGVPGDHRAPLSVKRTGRALERLSVCAVIQHCGFARVTPRRATS